MTMDDIERFYRRLRHKGFGLTEVVAIDKDSKKIAATGFFDDEKRFVSCCLTFNARCNIYAGRSPRPVSFFETSPENLNRMDTTTRKRAADKDIQTVTAISLDIDPIRPKDQPAMGEQRRAAVSFALDMQWDLGGDVYDSGNGAYVWFHFLKPIV